MRVLRSQPRISLGSSRLRLLADCPAVGFCGMLMKPVSRMENGREEAVGERRAGCVRVARVRRIVRVNIGLQVFALLRLQQLRVDTDLRCGPRSRSRAGAAGCDRTAEAGRAMGSVLQADLQGR